MYEKVIVLGLVAFVNINAVSVSGLVVSSYPYIRVLLEDLDGCLKLNLVALWQQFKMPM